MRKFMNASQVASNLGISRSTLWRLRSTGEFPEPVKISVRRIAWDPEEIERFISERSKPLTEGKGQNG